MFYNYFNYSLKRLFARCLPCYLLTSLSLKFDDKYCQKQIRLANSERLEYIDKEIDRNILNDGLSNDVSHHPPKLFLVILTNFLKLVFDVYWRQIAQECIYHIIKGDVANTCVHVIQSQREGEYFIESWFYLHFLFTLYNIKIFCKKISIIVYMKN